jgi:hypothetical protein
MDQDQDPMVAEEPPLKVQRKGGAAKGQKGRGGSKAAAAAAAGEQQDANASPTHLRDAFTSDFLKHR